MSIYSDKELWALIWFYWLCPQNKQAHQFITEAEAELRKRERANSEKPTTDQN